MFEKYVPPEPKPTFPDVERRHTDIPGECPCGRRVRWLYRLGGRWVCWYCYVKENPL